MPTDQDLKSLRRLVLALFTVLVIHICVVWSLNIYQATQIDRNQILIQENMESVMQHTMELKEVKKNQEPQELQKRLDAAHDQRSTKKGSADQ